jgi:PhzF family phenazine biosynthesis protein
MTLRIHVVDAFTGVPFRGNPAAVVVLDRPADEGWMQQVAAEMRHSETAFVSMPENDAEGTRTLRWFTPAAEVDLCGHATLATAHVLGGSQRFATRSGRLGTTAGPGGWPWTP